MDSNAIWYKKCCATYQRTMNLIFHDLIGKFMQVYIDDVVVKSESKDNHLDNLRLSFKRIRTHGLKMNSLICAFGVITGELLGFVIHQKGVEVDKSKAKDILETTPPKNMKQLQSLFGKVNFLKRFISNLLGKTVFLLRLKDKVEF